MGNESKTTQVGKQPQRPNWFGPKFEEQGGPGNSMPAPEFELFASCCDGFHGDLPPDGVGLPESDHWKSGRFGGTATMEAIRAGTQSFSEGDQHIAVQKLQQALVELNLMMPKAVNGIFSRSTKPALLLFQRNHQIPETGVFDKDTLLALEKEYNTRHVDTTFPKKDATTLEQELQYIDPNEAQHVKDHMLDQVSPTGSTAPFTPFLDNAAGVRTYYKDEVKARIRSMLQARISKYQTLETQRGPESEQDAPADHASPDPNPNAHQFDWKELGKVMQASQDAVKNVYGNFQRGDDLSLDNDGIGDMWTRQVSLDAALSPARKKRKARRKLMKWATGRLLRNINARYNASVSRAAERAIVWDIVKDLTDSPQEIQDVLNIYRNWSGHYNRSNGQGTLFLQRFKHAGNSSQAREKNRRLMWKHFHTGVHEALHHYCHPDFYNYANNLTGPNKATRAKVLKEGFCEYFTKNVKTRIKITDAMRRQIEGDYYDPKKPIPTDAQLRTGYYGEAKNAERVISIIGIANAQAAFFEGRIEYIKGH